MPFEAHLDRRKIAFLVAVGVAFVLIGVWMVGGFGPVEPSRRMSVGAMHVWGWIGIVFAALCLGVIAPRLFQSGVEIRVDSEGVYWRRWSDQVIPWSEVERITVGKVKRQQFACVFLHNPQVYRANGIAGWTKRLAGAFGTPRFGHVSLTVTGTDGRFDELMAAIRTFAPATLTSSGHWRRS